MSEKQMHRAEALSALSGVIEVNHELRRVRRQIDDLPRYSKCSEEQAEQREEIERRESRIEEQRTELIELAVIHALLAMSADEVSS